jgi:hypothetical protein
MDLRGLKSHPTKKLLLPYSSPGKMEAAGFSRRYLPDYTVSHPKRP